MGVSLRSGHNLSFLSCQHIRGLQCEEKINKEIKTKMGWPTLFSFLCMFVGLQVNSKFQTALGGWREGLCISILPVRHALLCPFKTSIAHLPALGNTVLFSSNRMATIHVPIGFPYFPQVVEGVIHISCQLEVFDADDLLTSIMSA